MLCHCGVDPGSSGDRRVHHCARHEARFQVARHQMGIKIHTTGISPPIGYAMFRIDGGRESSRHHHLRELVEQIRSFGIKVKYEIGDGAYYP